MAGSKSVSPIIPIPCQHHTRGWWWCVLVTHLASLFHMCLASTCIWQGGSSSIALASDLLSSGEKIYLHTLTKKRKLKQIKMSSNSTPLWISFSSFHYFGVCSFMLHKLLISMWILQCKILELIKWTLDMLRDKII